MSISIIFVEPETSGNIGALARVMANFSFKQLYLVSPKASVDAESRRRAKHGNFILKKAKIIDSFDKLPNLFDLLIGTTSKRGSDYNIPRMFIYPDMLAKYLAYVEGKIGIIFGRESIGLTNKELRKCDIIVSIPSDETYSALNISHAAGILLYEIFKQKNTSKKLTLASQTEKNILFKMFFEITKNISLPAKQIEHSNQVFFRVINRAFINKREIYSLIGAFRKIMLKLGLNPRTWDRN
jgi:TrmH family RNA methyltransferase